MYIPNNYRKIAYLICLFVVLTTLYLGWQVVFPPELSSGQPKNFYQSHNVAGISVGNLTGETQGQINQKLSDIVGLGFSWVRLDISWSKVQPSGPASYSWGPYDALVKSANRHHLKVLGILDYAPPWAAQSGCTNHSACAPKDAAQFASFAAEAARHYNQNVSDWEVWNEENLGKYWSPSPSAAQYAQILKQSYQAIKAVNPNALVMLGGMAVGNSPSGRQIPVNTFVGQLYREGIGGSFDALAYHPYTYPKAPSNSSSTWAELTILHSIMEAHGDGAKQVWITEYGAPTNGPSGSGFVSEVVQAQLAKEAYVATQRQNWIGPIFWFTYQDSGTDTSNKENFFGLKRADGSAKPAYYVWEQLLNE